LQLRLSLNLSRRLNLEFMRLSFPLHVLVVALAGATASAAPAESSSGPEGAARRLYVSKCARCHKFYDPARYSDQQWEDWMTKMSRKAKLKPDQQLLLSRYIESTLRHPKVPEKRTVSSP